MGKKDKKRKSSVSRSRRREKKEKKKAEKKRNTKEDKRRRKERSESSSSKGKAKAKESESSEVEEAPAAKDTPPAPAMAALDTPLIVSGCQNPTISDIVKGTYFRSGSHHGKPVYKKKQDAIPDDDDLDVLIYYWDDRDGDDNCGWWFSPSVGGEMVWAYHPSRKATTPPPAEWNVPHDGPIDKSFSVTAAPELTKKAAEKEEDEDEDEEEEEEEEEEEDEEVPKAKEEAKEPEEPEPDLTGLSQEERELALQEAEDRRLMQQLKQRELERKRKAEELKLKKEQEQKALEAEEKKKKKQKDKEQKKKDKEEKKRREEEERQRERDEEDRRRKDEDERRLKKEEEDKRRKEEEEAKERREEEERQEREREERRRKREEEERQEEEKRRKKAKEDEEERRRQEEERQERQERERREEEEREERRKRKEKEEKEEAERKEAERQKKEEERRKHEEKMQRKLDERRRGRSGDRRRSRDRDYSRGRDRHRDRRDRSRDRSRDRRDRSRDRRREEDDKEAREAREKAEKEHAAARAKEKEQRAVQTVLSMFQRMKGISLSNSDALKADFERIMASELPYCGEKEAELRAEAPKVTAEADENLAKLRQAHEEEMKRRAEEERVRLEQEAKKKRQNQANQNVLKALQKLQDATPATWSQLSADFQQVIQAELPETAPEQRENLQSEADRVFQYMEQLVKQMEQKQKEEEERERIRLEELRVKEQQTRQTVQELEQLLVKAEEEATKARQVTEQLFHLVNSGSSPSTAPRESLAAAFPNKAEEALRAARTAQRLGQVAQQALETAWKSLEQNKMQIFEVETLRHEVAHFVQRSEHRMQQAQMVAAQAVKMASESKERIGNTAAPAICDRKNGDVFRRYDQDEDGMLSANEVLSFCRLEYGFQLPQGNLDRILQHLAPGPGGVEPKKFHQLRTAVGIARFEVRAKKTKEAKTAPSDEEQKLKLEFQNHLKQRQQQMENQVEQIAWADLEKKIADVESTSASFVKAAADSNLPQDELQKFEANFDGALQQTRNALPLFVNQLRTLQQGALELGMKMAAPQEAKEPSKEAENQGKDEPKEEKEPKEDAKEPAEDGAKTKEPKEPGCDGPKDEALKSLKDKLRTASLRLAKFEARLVLSERKASEGRKVTARILAHKVEELRLDVACQLRKCIEHLGGKATDLFQIVSKGTDEASVEEAQVFLKENNCEMEMEKLSKAFAACKSTQDASTGPIKVTREEFGRIIRVCYEVTKEVDFTETLALNGPAMRTLQVGEILEVQAGPRNEPSKEGTLRIHARAQLDGALGWATLSSGEGEFLAKKPNPTS